MKLAVIMYLDLMIWVLVSYYENWC